MKKQFTEKELVDFGNYLLSEQRESTIENKDNIRDVHDCDLANFSESIKQKKQEFPEPKSLNGECAPYYLVYIEGYPPARAMYLEDENGEKAWYSNYTSKIIRPVLDWDYI